MGAYENPALIRDDRGKYIYQGLASFGQGIASGINAYAQRVDAAKKQSYEIEKERRQRVDRVNLAGNKAFNDWSKNVMDSIPANSEEIVFTNVQNFIKENADGYLDAFKAQALAETAEQRSEATAKILDFNVRAGMQTRGAANLNEHITQYKAANDSSEYVFFDKDYQIAMKMVQIGLPIAGFENLNISSKTDSNGETTLNLTADITDKTLAKEYGIDSENDVFDFKLNLNRAKTDSYIGKVFPPMDRDGIGSTSGILNTDGALNESGVIKTLNASNREITYYRDSASFVNSITNQANVLSKSYFSGSPEDEAQLKATLMNMNYSSDVVDNAIKMGHQQTAATATLNADGTYEMPGENSVADLIRDYNLRIDNTQQALATTETIADIERYNATVDDQQKMVVPSEGDVYLYSPAAEVTTTTTTTDGKQTEGQLARETAAAEVIAFNDEVAANTFTTPQNFIDYYLKQGNPSYGTPMTGEQAFDEVLQAVDKDGVPDAQYDKYRTTLAKDGRDAAIEQFKKDRGIGPKDILILDKSRAIKNRANIDNKKSMFQALLESQGFTAKNITKVLADFKQQQIAAIKEANPDADDDNLRIIFKANYW